MLLQSSDCIWNLTTGKKVAFPLHIEPCIHSARPPAGRPHTGLEAEQLAVRLEGEAMPAHTVKLATVYANYTTKKSWQTVISPQCVGGGREVKDEEKGKKGCPRVACGPEIQIKK